MARPFRQSRCQFDPTDDANTTGKRTMSIPQVARWPAVAVLCGVLSGCAATPHYENTLHPDYGQTRYDTDLAQCREQNSKTTVVPGYEDKIVKQVDENAAQACVSALGWRQTKT
jgi:hypothetical protein